MRYPTHARRARGRLALALALAGVLAFAPGASAEAPEATDFSQPIPDAERMGISSDGHPVYRSVVLPAPARFDLAGVGGQTGEVELRGRVADGEWTDWTPSANGDPVWFGGMDELQIRAHDWKPSGRVSYVSVTEGSLTEDSDASTAPTALRAGDSGMPNVVSRRQWGANDSETGCRPRSSADYGKVKAASVHHTVSAVNYSESQAPGMVLGICRFHRNTNGWNDIGYNAVVDRFGNIYAGRAGGLGRAVVGAHAEGVNAQTTGVAMLGTHSSVPITRPAMRGLSKWLAWKLPQHGHDTTGRARLTSAGGGSARYPAGKRFRTRRIIGHRATNLTECPGDALAGQLGKVRKKTQRRIDGGGGSGDGGGSDGGGIGG